jgi:hypothetical protein
MNIMDNTNYQQIIFELIAIQKWDGVEDILKTKIDPDIRDSAGNYLIHILIYNNQIKLLNLLLKLEPRLDILDPDGKQICYLPLRYNQVNILEALLKDNEIIYRNQEPCSYAEYSYENKGHTHMNLKYYTHFTSPIRRIVDQYIHQVLIQKLFDNKLTVKKLDVDKINIFERELKKINLQWNYLKVSNKITNGKIFKIQFIGFDSKSIEFKLLEDNIIIYNKLFFKIIDNNTININSVNYEINKIYELPIYIVDNIKNQYFPKLLIKF